jgi:hypothetical protein
MYDDKAQKSAEESQGKIQAIRFARDKVQLSTLFNNRKVYTDAAEDVKIFDDWLLLHRSALRKKRPRDTTETPPQSAAEGAAPEETQRVGDRVVLLGASSQGLTPLPSASPEPSRCLQISDTTPLTAAGDTDWVTVFEQQPDLQHELNLELTEVDRKNAEKSLHWRSQEDLREEELASLRKGKLIWHPILFRCLDFCCREIRHLYVVPESVFFGSAGNRNANEDVPTDRTILFLLFFDQHYIAAGCHPPTPKKPGVLLEWWDSLQTRSRSFVESRTATLNKVLELLKVVFPSCNVDAKRSRSDEQSPASNDCGVFALQNLLDFAGVSRDVSREWLTKFATGEGRIS